MAIKLPPLIPRGEPSARTAEGDSVTRPWGTAWPYQDQSSVAANLRHSALSGARVLVELALLAFVAGVLVLTLRGIPGNPTPADLQQPRWEQNGPLELSPERGHYVLTVSLAENRTTQLSIPLARFATPDVGYIHGHYVTLFQPGLSVFLLPGYILGRAHNMAQVGMYLGVAIFALANAWLIRLIVVHLGGSRVAGWLAALVFLFASPAFTYAVSLFQHHVTLFLLLCPMYLLLRWRSAWVLALTWLMYGLAIFVDYPSAILMAPVAVLASTRMLGISHLGPAARVYLARWSSRQDDGDTWYTISLRLKAASTVLAFLIPMAMLLWFNYQSYGNPLRLSGTVPRVPAIDEQGQPTIPQGANPADAELYLRPDAQSSTKTVSSFFDTRLLLQGLYIHLISPDRGMLYYTPVMFFGILGGWLLAKKNRQALCLILAIIGLDLTLYSLWGDPWGGWAFGSRYLVPSYAMLAILIGLALDRLPRNKIVLGLFCLALMYSLGVNTLGAITSSANPPQVEVGPLEKLTGHVEPYTWERNWDFLNAQGSKSVVYQALVAGHLSATQYYWLLAAMLGACCLALLAWLCWRRSPRRELA
jgi:hypothetical protein